jgi:hypothetical protein
MLRDVFCSNCRDWEGGIIYILVFVLIYVTLATLLFPFSFLGNYFFYCM